MKIQLFNLKGRLPFSQGYAIAEIAKTVSGTLIQAGQVVEGDNDQFTLLYTRFRHGGGDVKNSESLWVDDGVSVRCRYHRINNNTWQEKVDDRWSDVALDLSFTEEQTHSA